MLDTPDMPARLYPPKTALQSGARIGSMAEYRQLYRKSIESPEEFWDQQASRLDFFAPYDRVCSADFGTAAFSWFENAKLNVSHNCVDRHVARRGDQVAIIWAKDAPGEYERITYRQLRDEVCRMANVLKHHGVRKGDRVCLYMPMIPDLAYAMLACARIGAVHSVVFAGFSARSLRNRIVDADCRIVLTANEGLRGGKTIPLKATVDAAIEGLKVGSVLVARRTEQPVRMQEGRDHWLADEMARQRPFCPCEWMDAEDPLFVLYTSGSTGNPKGLLHTTAGYLLYAAITHEWIFDYHDGDIYCCAADIGWITGHSYIVYGPLANGATTVMFESTPLYPDPGRYWQLVEDLGIDIFYTAPTALRAIHRHGDDYVTRHDRTSLRVLGTVGEPINPEVWEWYHDVVGAARCAVVDTWWQTETGGILISPLPGATPCKPGSATFPFFGVKPVLIGEGGEVLEGAEARGNLCIEASWPGQARTIYGDHARFIETYFSQYPGRYFTGDGCRRDADGYYWITGRVDDVLNVSGHRLGTAEIESALVAHEAVAEAAVVGMPHELKGQGVYAYVLLKGEGDAIPGIEETLVRQVRTMIGAIASPDRIQIVPALPKTRSGKIMRRILRQVAQGQYEDLGDLSTLAEPESVQQIIDGHRRASRGADQ